VNNALSKYDMSEPCYTGPVYIMWDSANAQSGSCIFTDFS
jgi:hypothetical protein